MTFGPKPQLHRLIPLCNHSLKMLFFQKQQRQGVLAKTCQDNELDLLGSRYGAQVRVQVDFFTCQSEKYDPIQTCLFIDLP